MRLTLGDVLDQPGLGLELCTGGEAARAAPVDGAHAVDHLRNPVQWLQENWILLTTGLQLRGRAAAQRKLIGELCDGNITALGFGVGISLARVPRALLQEAERRDFPIFVVPLETPFREIISVVNRSALSTDLYVLRRLTSMQRYLLGAMREEAPEQALVERLASVLGGADVVHLDPAGTPVAATASDLDWVDGALREAAANLREFEYEGRWGVIAPVHDGDTGEGWLAALLASATVTHQVARPVVRSAGELLGVVAATRLTVGREQSERRARLAARLIRALEGEPDDGLAGDLAAESVDFTRPCRVAVLARADDGPVADVRDELTAALRTVTSDCVLGFDEDRAFVLAQHDLEPLATTLAARTGLAEVRAGVSEGVERLAGAGAGFDQAALALTVALSGPPAPAVQRHEALEPSVALLGGDAGDRRHERLIGVLEPLSAEPRLRAAVVAYLDAGLDVGRAAHALGLHRNSLRYRLDRAEELLGGSLRSPGTLATVHLALLAERLQVTIGDRRGGAWHRTTSGRGRE